MRIAHWPRARTEQVYGPVFAASERYRAGAEISRRAHMLRVRTAGIEAHLKERRADSCIGAFGYRVADWNVEDHAIPPGARAIVGTRRSRHEGRISILRLRHAYSFGARRACEAQGDSADQFR